MSENNMAASEMEFHLAIQNICLYTTKVIDLMHQHRIGLHDILHLDMTDSIFSIERNTSTFRQMCNDTTEHPASEAFQQQVEAYFQQRTKIEV